MTGIAVWLANIDTLLNHDPAAPPSRRFHAPRILLGLALSAAKGDDKIAWRFDVEKPGRLIFGNDSASVLYYDVSQAGRTIVVALSGEGPVGVSLESLTPPAAQAGASDAPLIDAIRESVFDERELDRFDALHPLERWSAVQRAWAAKDASMKRELALPPVVTGVAAKPDDSGPCKATWSRLESRDLTIDDEKFHLAIAARPGCVSELHELEFVITPEAAASPNLASERL